MSLNTRELIDRKILEVLARERIADFRALRKQGRHAGAIYLGVYAVECLLKACICKTLNLDRLPAAFKEHDLEVLLKFSGLDRRIKSDSKTYNSLKKLTGLWNPSDESRSIRYIHDSARYNAAASNDVHKWLNARDKGVVPWLRKYLK